MITDFLYIFCVTGVPKTVTWSFGSSLSEPLSQAQLLLTVTLNEPPLTMMPVSLFTPLGFPMSLEPVVVMLSVPPLNSTFSAQLMPLPPSPLLVIVNVPADMTKRLSLLMPAADVVSLIPSTVLISQSPLVVIVVCPPLMVVRASHLMPRAPLALTSMVSVPPLMVNPSFTFIPFEPVSDTLTVKVPSSMTMKSSLAMPFFVLPLTTREPDPESRSALH